jgi:hypothetical protein
MTIDELQRFALRLANAGWTRYWMHYNYPCRDPWLMAIEVIDHHGLPAHIPDLEGLGFSHEFGRYVIARTNDDGTPFESNL